MATAKHYYPGFLSLDDTFYYVTEDGTIKPEWLGSSLNRRLDCRRFLKMLHLVVLVALLFQACSALVVTMKPYNMSQEVGQNVTLACLVENKPPVENVQWKFKQNGTTTYNALTFNGNVLGTATKYALVGTYNLTVIKLTASDEGTYRCIVGLKNYDMHLAVVDLPSSVTITWGSENQAGTMANLTCTATPGRPPAPLKWIIDGVDYTAKAYNKSGLISASGFGDSISTLPLYLDNRVKDKLAQCFVSYDGWDKAMNDTYIIQHNTSPKVRIYGSMISVAMVMLVILQ